MHIQIRAFERDGSAIRNGKAEGAYLERESLRKRTYKHRFKKQKNNGCMLERLTAGGSQNESKAGLKKFHRSRTKRKGEGGLGW